MPRPPRTKVASRVAKSSKAKVAPQKQPEQAATQNNTVTEAVDSFSEDSDGLVTRPRATRSSRKLFGEKTPEAVSAAELTMTGALPAQVPAPHTMSEATTPALSASKRTQVTRGSARVSAQKASPILAPSALPRATRANAREEVPSLDEGSGFDLTMSSLGSDSPAHGTRPPSAIKIGATPAHERSVLALTNFKRRARQPSLLRMVQQTTDVEDNDVSGLDNTDNFDFDDFLPHAESTPLNPRKIVPDDDVRNDSGTHVSSSGSRGTKRKLSPIVQVPRSSPPFTPPSGADLESARSLSPSLPEILPSREEIIGQTQDDQDLLSETYAPPRSSSPIPEPEELVQSPAQQRPRRRGRTNRVPVYDEESDAEGTETSTKNKKRTKTKSQPTISTAQLKQLLPRRRNRARDHDEFHLESSEEVTQLDSDQDELQMPMRRHRPHPGAGKSASPKAAKKGARSKKGIPSKSKQRVGRTYSRRISSDKENDVEQAGEEVDEVSAIEHSEKLAAIRRKFEEVDKFELEFEDVDAVTSSSPYR
ncbi:hypothetical protein ACN47E_006902 [Coniothyrium glycines]